MNWLKENWPRILAGLVIIGICIAVWQVWRSRKAADAPTAVQACGDVWMTSCKSYRLDAKTLTLRDQVQKQVADGKLPGASVVPNCDKSDLVMNGDGTWDLCKCSCVLASTIK